MKKKKTAKVKNVEKVDEVQEVQEAQDLTIVLNGGGLEMKGATIPVKWYFSKDLALKAPTHILLVDLTEVEARENISVTGRRYLVEVEKAAKFFQVFKSGKHIMLAIAFKKLSAAAHFLVKSEESKSFYAQPIYISATTNHETFNSDYNRSGMILASTKVEFTVPQELFAKKPETKMAKLFFNYLYWPNTPRPRDECQVRKLAIFYGLPKLPFFLLINLLYAVYLPLASLIILFSGYQSISLSEIFRRIFSPVAYGYEPDVYVVGQSRTQARAIYRNGVQSFKETWFSPFHLTGLFSFLAFFLWLFKTSNANVLFPGFTVIAILFTLLFAFFILRRFFDEEAVGVTLAVIFFLYTFVIGMIFLFFREIPIDGYRTRYLVLYAFELGLGGVFLALLLRERIVGSSWYEKHFKMKPEEKKGIGEKIYSDYLLENFTTPERELNLKDLPDTFETNKLKRDLTIRFWSAKADACKPYEN